MPAVAGERPAGRRPAGGHRRDADRGGPDGADPDGAGGPLSGTALLERLRVTGRAPSYRRPGLRRRAAHLHRGRARRPVARVRGIGDRSPAGDQGPPDERPGLPGPPVSGTIGGPDGCAGVRPDGWAACLQHASGVWSTGRRALPTGRHGGQIRRPDGRRPRGTVAGRSPGAARGLDRGAAGGRTVRAGVPRSTGRPAACSGGGRRSTRRGCRAPRRCSAHPWPAAASNSASGSTWRSVVRPAARPSVALVDVVSGARRPEHGDDRRFAALVAALRGPVPPFAVATYYSRTGELDVDPVDHEYLVAGAHRCLAAVRVLLGREPAPSDGSMCAACRGYSAGHRSSPRWVSPIGQADRCTTRVPWRPNRPASPGDGRPGRGVPAGGGGVTGPDGATGGALTAPARGDRLARNARRDPSAPGGGCCRCSGRTCR